MSNETNKGGKEEEEVEILLSPVLAPAAADKIEEEEEEEEEAETGEIEEPSSPTQALGKMFEDAQDAAYVVKKDVEELASSAADFFSKLQFDLFNPETREDSPAKPNSQRTSSKQNMTCLLYTSPSPRDRG